MDEIFEQIFSDTGVRGDVAVFSDAVLAAVGRGFGTLTRQKGEARVVVGRSDDAHSRRAAAALARALVVSGHQVTVVAVVQFEDALLEGGICVGVDDDELVMSFYRDGKALLGGGLQALRTLAADGRYCAGEGELFLPALGSLVG